MQKSRNFEILRVQCRRARQELFNGIKIVSNGPNLASFRFVEISELRCRPDLTWLPGVVRQHPSGPDPVCWTAPPGPHVPPRALATVTIPSGEVSRPHVRLGEGREPSLSHPGILARVHTRA